MTEAQATPPFWKVWGLWGFVGTPSESAVTTSRLWFLGARLCDDMFHRQVFTLSDRIIQEQKNAQQSQAQHHPSDLYVLMLVNEVCLFVLQTAREKNAQLVTQVCVPVWPSHPPVLVRARACGQHARKGPGPGAFPDFLRSIRCRAESP